MERGISGSGRGRLDPRWNATIRFRSRRRNDEHHSWVLSAQCGRRPRVHWRLRSAYPDGSPWGFDPRKRDSQLWRSADLSRTQTATIGKQYSQTPRGEKNVALNLARVTLSFAQHAYGWTENY